MWTFGLGGFEPLPIPVIEKIEDLGSQKPPRGKRKRGKDPVQNSSNQVNGNSGQELRSSTKFQGTPTIARLETLFNAALNQQMDSHDDFEYSPNKKIKVSKMKASENNATFIPEENIKISKFIPHEKESIRHYWDRVCSHLANIHFESQFDMLWNPSIWATITVLDLQFVSNRCDNVLKDILQSCRNVLEVVKIGPQCKISNADLKMLSTILNLRHLKFVCCSLKKAKTGLRSIFSMKNITRIEFIKCDGIDDQALENISKMAHITRLTLSDLSQITDDGLKSLSKWKLTTLKLEKCPQITRKALNYLREVISFLDKLVISNMNWVDNEVVSQIARLIPSLHHLDIRSAPVTYECISSLKSLNLTTLSFMHCPMINDRAVELMAELNFHCEVVKLSYTSITNASFNILCNMASITHLDISGTQINDQGILTVTRNVTLKELHISNCKFITDTGILNLSAFVNLLALCVHNCPNITKNALSSLRQLEKVSFSPLMH